MKPSDEAQPQQSSFYCSKQWITAANSNKSNSTIPKAQKWMLVVVSHWYMI